MRSPAASRLVRTDLSFTQSHAPLYQQGRALTEVLPEVAADAKTRSAKFGKRLTEIQPGAPEVDGLATGEKAKSRLEAPLRHSPECHKCVFIRVQRLWGCLIL